MLFVDVGWHTAIEYFLGCRASAVAAARELGQSRSALKVELRQAARFWPAEGYHQNYAENNAVKYNFYRFSCGRDRRLDSVWGNNARSGNAWGK